MTQPESVFAALLASVQKAADYNRDDVAPPAAVLWPDEKREWERLVPRLRLILPHFLILGPYDKANRSGPAIWLRCVLAGKVPELAWASGTVPILYLPGVSRSTLRATEDCPQELKPLAELQYRGVFWSQGNGKDWTVTAFLQTNQGGLQLKVAKDNATAASIRRAVEKLVDVPVAELRGKAGSGELNSTYFDSLISDDPVDDLLSWLSDPRGTKGLLGAGPLGDAVQPLPGRLRVRPDPRRRTGRGREAGTAEKSAWKTAWKRFASAPSRYPGLLDLLRRAKPPSKGGSLFESQTVENPGPRTTRPRKPLCGKPCSMRRASRSARPGRRSSTWRRVTAVAANGCGPS